MSPPPLGLLEDLATLVVSIGGPTGDVTVLLGDTLVGVALSLKRRVSSLQVSVQLSHLGIVLDLMSNSVPEGSVQGSFFRPSKGVVSLS